MMQKTLFFLSLFLLLAGGKPLLAQTSKFTAIQPGECRWTGGFWGEKFAACEQQMLPYMEDVLTSDVGHALNNFKIAAGLKTGEHQGMRWHDGDFYKFLEAAVHVYARNEDPALLRRIDGYIAIIAGAQREDGYLQTQAQLREDIEPYSNRRNHEMYNSGHLLTAAVVHHRVTGQRNFLDIALRHADLMYDLFYPESEQYARFGFNQTQIIGLVDLYKATGKRKYLDLAERFINRRGRYKVQHDASTAGYPIGDMVQERTPLREADEAVGHAVLALYFYAGAADVYAETGEKALLEALDRLWADMTNKKMYVTGALGQAHFGVSGNRDLIQEGFIEEYMLPNLTAYNETCANVCNAHFNFRMLGIHGQARFADVIELVLYNSALSGIALDGASYFYANPLRMINDARDFSDKNSVTELSSRAPYLNCFCCPPNLVRTIAQSSDWAYSRTEGGLAVNLYGSNTISTTTPAGEPVSISQQTNYPWEGDIAFTMEEVPADSFGLQLRIPGWAREATLRVNGQKLEATLTPGTYTQLRRKWKRGDVVELSLPLTIEWVEGHPRVEEIRNQAVLKRGPVVYCLESADLPPGTDITAAYLPYAAGRKAVYEPDLLGGVTTIETEIWLREHDQDNLYRPVRQLNWEKIPSRLVPYFSWANRGAGEMTVWLPAVW